MAEVSSPSVATPMLPLIHVPNITNNILPPRLTPFPFNVDLTMVFITLNIDNPTLTHVVSVVSTWPRAPLTMKALLKARNSLNIWICAPKSRYSSRTLLLLKLPLILSTAFFLLKRYYREYFHCSNILMFPLNYLKLEAIHGPASEKGKSPLRPHRDGKPHRSKATEHLEDIEERHLKAYVRFLLLSLSILERSTVGILP